jgi:hypothetical protein
MFVRSSFAGLVLAGLLLAAGSARADHDHVTRRGAHAFGVGLTVLGASFDTTIYAGNYLGVLPSVRWSNRRFALGASAALYRLDENGARFYGSGDVVVSGQATLFGDAELHAGIVAAVTVPVGDERHGLGMGHAMAMPALFVMWMPGRFATTATAGGSRALAEDTGHDHGMWPIVEPMNFQELTWSASGEYALTRHVNGGLRVSGGVPIGGGDQRVVGAVRVGWTGGRFTSAVELQAGLVGDPFIVRGLVSSAIQF